MWEFVNKSSHQRVFKIVLQESFADNLWWVMLIMITLLMVKTIMMIFLKLLYWWFRLLSCCEESLDEVCFYFTNAWQFSEDCVIEHIFMLPDAFLVIYIVWVFVLICNHQYLWNHFFWSAESMSVVNFVSCLDECEGANSWECILEGTRISCFCVGCISDTSDSQG